MRTELTFKAFAREPNRYRLAQLAAKATRALHRPNTRVQDTMNDALERLGTVVPSEADLIMKSPLEPKSAEDLRAA